MQMHHLIPWFLFPHFPSVEATTLNERAFSLRAQDKLIRDNLREDDILIVSVGGNDVALCPTPCTIASITGLVCLPTSFVANGFNCCAVPVSQWRATKILGRRLVYPWIYIIPCLLLVHPPWTASGAGLLLWMRPFPFIMRGRLSALSWLFCPSIW